MRKILFIVAMLTAFTSNAQKRHVDTLLNVVSNNAAHWKLNITADSNLLLYTLYDSAFKPIDTRLIPNVPSAGRTSRKILVDSLKALKLRYNLTIAP